ncbi:MAG TPA: M14 family zinc carboxypeptidase, partial [Gemmatimonadales bacterium]|nr:M14 family zinc carboxypeptidase [Gemmatimonadales bacterium]
MPGISARLLVVSGALLLGAAAPPAAAQYLSHDQLDAALTRLARQAGIAGSLETIATSPGGRAVRALRIGPAGQPALLVIANAHGPQLIGSSIALAAAQARIGAADGRTVWFIPRLNPDAAEAMFAAVKSERTGNDAGSDDDRDQRTGEDPVNDLDGDGAIVQLRLADPNGAWIADSAEPRLLRRADRSKGEVGAWTVVSEGRDDDGDGRYNEDGPGGTDVNRNFTYDHDHHGREAGPDPMSSPEARGLAEFMIVHPEIAAVYVIGPQDNLMKPWENRPNAGIMNPETRERAQEGTSAGGPLNSILSADQPTFAAIARRFQAAMKGHSRTPPSASLKGDVLSWSYYHFGRWAFGAPGWWPPEVPRDSTERGGAGRTGGGSSAGSDPVADQRAALKWYESQGIDAFVTWTPVALGGTERRSGEVGGFKPG